MENTFYKYLLLPFLGIFGVSVMPLAAQKKSLNIVLTQANIIIDGDMREDAWQSANIASDFETYLPTFGAPASQKTEVRMMYDQEAIYVFAKLYDDPNLIRKTLSRRDEKPENADEFKIALATYNDLRTAYYFSVTAANVQSEKYMNNTNWFCEWQSAVAIVADGWQVEMRIPLYVLRFPQKDKQVWGLQFFRTIFRLNETNTWNPMTPLLNLPIDAPQFGELTGLTNLAHTTRRIFQPYAGVSNTQAWGGLDMQYSKKNDASFDFSIVPNFEINHQNTIDRNWTATPRLDTRRMIYTEGGEISSNYSAQKQVGDFFAWRTMDNFRNDFSGKTIDNVRFASPLGVSGQYSMRNSNNVGFSMFNTITLPLATAQITDVITGEQSTTSLTSPTNVNAFSIQKVFGNASEITVNNRNIVNRNYFQNDFNIDAIFRSKNLGWEYGVSVYDNQAQAKQSNSTSSNSSNMFNAHIAKTMGNFQFRVNSILNSQKFSSYSFNSMYNNISLTYQIIDKNKYFIHKSVNLRIAHLLQITPDMKWGYGTTIMVNAITKNMETWRGVVQNKSVLGQYISDQRKPFNFRIGIGANANTFRLLDIQTNYRVNNYLRLFYDFCYRNGYDNIMSFGDNMQWRGFGFQNTIVQEQAASTRITFSNKSDLQLSFLSQHIENTRIFHQYFRLNYQYQFSKMGLFNVSVQTIDYTNFVGDKTPRFSVGYIQQFKR